MKLRCLDCEQSWPFDPLRWRCGCGGVVEILEGPGFDPAGVDQGEYTMWRYGEALPGGPADSVVTLGEGWTPLVDAEWEDRPVRFKMESLNPTGSFKDRGAALLVSALRAADVDEVVDDSSGNAGAALSAYCARGRVAARIFVPQHASPAKRAQIAVYGAELVTVPGSRTDTTRALLEAVEEGAVYGSHAYSPLYAHGVKTIAFELWEQSGRRAPESIIVPVGHGGLLLGLHLGFRDLRAAGVIEDAPALYGVQAAACAPLARAWERGSDNIEPVDEGETVAGGVRIAAPPWGSRVLDAVRQSGGGLLALSDEETLSAQRRLAQLGFYVEPTSALPVAAIESLRARLSRLPVVVLTGNGLKSPPAATEPR